MTDPIPIHDRGLLLGDGLFETILAEHGRLVWFEAHAKRLVAGCAVLGLPPPDAPRLRQAALSAIAEAGLEGERAAVRLTWTAGSGGRGLDRPAPVAPRLLAAASSAPRPAGPVTLATVSVRRNAGSPASRLKTLSYLDNVLARCEARAAGADEAVMLNTDGRLACAAAGNLFWIEAGRLSTPALELGVLDGVTRAVVLDLAAELGLAAAQVSAGPEALAGAEAVFVTNSLIGIRPASRLDGRAFAPHGLIDRLARALAVRIMRQG